MEDMKEMESNEDMSEEELDKELAVKMAIGVLFSDDGRSQILNAVQGNDPVGVVAKAAFGALKQVREQFIQRGIPLSDDVFLGEEGAAAEIVVYLFAMLEEELQMPMDEDAFDAALSMIEQDASTLVQAEMGNQPVGGPQMPPQGVAQQLAGGM